MKCLPSNLSSFDLQGHYVTFILLHPTLKVAETAAPSPQSFPPSAIPLIFRTAVRAATYRSKFKSAAKVAEKFRASHHHLKSAETGNENQVRETLRLVEEVTYDLTTQSVPRPQTIHYSKSSQKKK